MINERHIVRQLRNGDEEAFESIFSRYFNKLCVYSNQIVNNKQVAEEIVEDFFLHLWEKCSDIDIHVSLRAYLFRSVHNKSLKYLRHLKVEQKYRETVNGENAGEEMFQPVSHDYPIANLLSEELEDKIETAIRNLPDQCREVFLHHRMKKLSYQEIAVKLNISVNTVKTQMARAMKKMREELKDYLP